MIHVELGFANIRKVEAAGAGAVISKGSALVV